LDKLYQVLKTSPSHRPTRHTSTLAPGVVSILLAAEIET